VQEHLATLGPRGEQWVSTRMGLVAENEREDCPFCAQTLANSSLVAQYRGYFSEEYARLKGEIAELLRLLERQHGGNTRATFERSVRIAQERRQFWHCASRSH
jgi:wobble nucleotide-excising tRNase